MNSDSLSIQNFLLPIILPDGNVILGMIANRREGSIFKRYCFYFCFDGNDFGLTFTSSLGENNNLDYSYTIIPNPAYKNLTLDFHQAFSGFVEIINIEGSVLDRMELSNISSTQLNLETFTNGVYILRATSDSGGKINKKFIINN